MWQIIKYEIANVKYKISKLGIEKINARNIT